MTESPDENDTDSWYRCLAGVTSAVGALVCDDRGRVLLAQPTYKPEWVFVGGTVDQGEAPLAALRRELVEELGPTLRAKVEVGRLLVTDWVPPQPGWDRPMHHLVFDCGTLSAAELSSVPEPSNELRCVTFVARTAVENVMAPHESRRLTWALRAREAGIHHYLENGLEVFADR